MFLSPILKNTSQKDLFFPFKSYEIKSYTVLYLTEYQEETKHLSVFIILQGICLQSNQTFSIQNGYCILNTQS